MESPRCLGSWLRDRGTGRIVIAQFPNPALGVFLIAYVWRRLPGTAIDPRLSGIASGALIVWAADELFRGASPFRRMLGAIVLAGQLFGLLSR